MNGLQKWAAGSHGPPAAYLKHEPHMPGLRRPPVVDLRSQELGRGWRVARATSGRTRSHVMGGGLRGPQSVGARAWVIVSGFSKVIFGDFGDLIFSQKSFSLVFGLIFPPCKSRLLLVVCLTLLPVKIDFRW